MLLGTLGITSFENLLTEEVMRAGERTLKPGEAAI